MPGPEAEQRRPRPGVSGRLPEAGRAEAEVRTVERKEWDGFDDLQKQVWMWLSLTHSGPIF